MIFLKTKLKNAITKFNSNYVVELDNISINGNKRGCSGFITNPNNGIVVYVDTEKICYHPLSDQNLCRYAKKIGDYGGSHSRNRFATDSNLAYEIHKMLQDIDGYNNWKERCCHDFI